MSVVELITHSEASSVVHARDLIAPLTWLDKTAMSARWTA
jgi:hypothetical protein